MSEDPPGHPPARGGARDPWHFLSRFTTARIGLGRAGSSLPTRALLEFQLAHARARDAVLHDLDVAAVSAALDSAGLESLVLQSAAADRATYIARPDLGRLLSADAMRTLAARASPSRPWDAAFVIADGLWALAVETHAVPLLGALLPALVAEGWSLAPVVIARQGRVAIGDEIGVRLPARITVVLIGERPGLSSPDSLGAYLTHDPRPGRTNAERNCVSNIREPGGLAYALAAHRLHYLLAASRRLGFSGVALRESAPALARGDAPVRPADEG